MNGRFLAVLLALILAVNLIGCSSPGEKTASTEPGRVAETKSVELGGSSTTSATVKNPVMMVDTILTAFPECSKERALVYKSDRILTFAAWGPKETQVFVSIAPDGQCVNFLEIGTVVTPGEASKLTDERLEPLKRLLSTLFPEWGEGLTWLRAAFKKMPYTETRENWKLKVWESSDGGLFVTATQDLKPAQSTATIAASDPRNFEKLVVANGKPVVTGARVEDDHGKVNWSSSAEFLMVWVSPTWYKFTDVEKKYFIKIHVDAFNKWKGDDKGIVIVFDAFLREEVGSGSKYGITLKK